MSLEKVSENVVFGGVHRQYTHESNVLNCKMRFAIYLPPQAQNQSVPVLYWLSGLTCSDENFMQKAAAQRLASELGLALIACDTSPRGEGVSDASDGAYDLGLGAGFYLNATEAPWKRHYQMYDYVTRELPSLIEAHFPVTEQRAISGHSMGGHGALVIGLRNPERYQSISAFSPIVNPSACPWGRKAFEHYLGYDESKWAQYDATELMKLAIGTREILISQGESDEFLATQLLTQNIVKVAKTQDYPLTVRMQPGYDHSYYFISSFIEDHLRFHAQHLLV